MRKRVYIETTIPSFYHTLRTDSESIARMNWTREWWADTMEHIRLVNYELGLPMPLLMTPLNYLIRGEFDA